MEWSNFLSGSISNVVASALVGVIAFVLGSFRKELLLRFRTRKTRKFWKPFRNSGVTLVLGREFAPDIQENWIDLNRTLNTAELHDFEPFGLVGYGDVMALIQLRDHLQLLDLRVKVTHSGDSNSFKSQNIVTIGGPDANRVTATAMKSLQLPLQFASAADNHRTELDDLEQGIPYLPEFSPSLKNLIRADYGFVARGPSPFNSETAIIVILAGVYGSGTWGAAQVVTNSRGVDRLLRFTKDTCFAIFRVEVYGSQISVPKILDARAFDSPGP